MSKSKKRDPDAWCIPEHLFVQMLPEGRITRAMINGHWVDVDRRKGADRITYLRALAAWTSSRLSQAG
jgi:hypothetical protein